jgi:hypothetical protein
MGQSREVSSVAFSPNSARMVTGTAGAGATAKVWHAPTTLQKADWSPRTLGPLADRSSFDPAFPAGPGLPGRGGPGGLLGCILALNVYSRVCPQDHPQQATRVPACKVTRPVRSFVFRYLRVEAPGGAIGRHAPGLRRWLPGNRWSAGVSLSRRFVRREAR